MQRATAVRSGRLTALQRHILLAILENEESVEPGWPELLKAASAANLARLVLKEKLGTKSELSADRACLLYTSPSPRDRQKSRMPSSA